MAIQLFVQRELENPALMRLFLKEDANGNIKLKRGVKFTFKKHSIHSLTQLALQQKKEQKEKKYEL